MLLEGAINALGKVGLMLNVHKDDLAAVLAVLPALKRPTISHLSDEEWLAVNTILDESTVRDIIPRLKEAGGAGNCGIPAQQDRAVMSDTGEQGYWPPAGAEGGAIERGGSGGAADSGRRAEARRPALMEYARQFDGLDRQERARAGEGARSGAAQLTPEFRAAPWRPRRPTSAAYAERQMPREWTQQMQHGVAAGADRAAARYGGGVHPRGPLSAALHHHDDGGSGAGGGRAEHLRRVAASR